MSLFTISIAQATVLSLCKVTESMLGHVDVPTEHQRYVIAAQEIVKLSKCLRRLSYFKVSPASLRSVVSSGSLLNISEQVHPFTPIPLLLCGEYFTAHRSRDAAFGTASIEIIEALRELKNVNVASDSYLEQLESNLSNEFGELSHQGSSRSPPWYIWAVTEKGSASLVAMSILTFARRLESYTSSCSRLLRSS
nr:hypothetical protein CFP56_79123 [Quercus suber]